MVSKDVGRALIIQVHMNDQVHQKGWVDGSEGHGHGRAVTDAEFNDGAKILRDCGWSFDLNMKEQKQLEGGGIPKKLELKMKNAKIVLRDSTVEWNLMPTIMTKCKGVLRDSTVK